MFKNIINKSPFLIRLFNWEYWPMYVVYFPVSVYYIYLAARARSFFFFSTTNPTIETGGMFFESKWSIFKMIPKKYFPKTIFISENNSKEETLSAINNSGIKYPFIAKPDRGERGWGIRKISDEAQLGEYIEMNPVDFLIQDFVSHPVELSIFYYRHPSRESGVISSVTYKELLRVKGNGKDKLRDLIMNDPRALLQLEVLEEKFAGQMDDIVAEGEEKLLVPLGNHCKGALFLNYNHIIDEALVRVFDDISKQIEGFYYGRYDLKCSSLEDLKQGKNISIVELNGAGAEPAHIYHPNFPILKGQHVIFSHFNKMCDIGIENSKRGYKYMDLKEFISVRKRQSAYKNKVNMA